MTAAVKQATLDEYLAMERASETKHEYFAGIITAMAGTSFRHNVLAGNVTGALRSALANQPCFVCPSDMRVRTRSTLYTYPDVTVICGEPQFEDDREDILTNPVVIFEILSPSTEAYDRGVKFEHYRSIASLKEYVLVAQDRVRVEHFARQSTGQWLLTAFSEKGDELRLPTLDIALPLDELYAKVELPAVPPLHPGDEPIAI